MNARSGIGLAGTAGLLVALTASAVAAQARDSSVRFGVSWGVLVFGAATEPLPGAEEPTEALPWRPTLSGIALRVGGGAVRVSFSAAYGSAGLAVRGVSGTGGEPPSNVVLVANNAFHLGAMTLGVSRRLTRLPGGPSLWPSAGVILERWTAPAAAPRLVAGIQGGLRLEVPLSRRFDFGLEATIGHSGASPIDPAALPEGFRGRPTWRRGITAEVGVKM